MASPDKWGRYRVRTKAGKSGSWSTRNYNPTIHVIASGPASDTYGAALPPKPYAPKAPTVGTEKKEKSRDDD